jgi:hypothetical protein
MDAASLPGYVVELLHLLGIDSSRLILPKSRLAASPLAHMPSIGPFSSSRLLVLHPACNFSDIWCKCKLTSLSRAHPSFPRGCVMADGRHTDGGCAKTLIIPEPVGCIGPSHSQLHILRSYLLRSIVTSQVLFCRTGSTEGPESRLITMIRRSRQHKR